MRPIQSLLLFILAVFVGGALLAPWLYRLAQWTEMESLTKYPFHRYVTRCMNLVALIGLWPFLRSLGVRSWSSVGLVNPAEPWKWLGGGFALGFVSFAGVAVLAGSAFGRFGSDNLRLSYANSRENLALALERMRGFLDSL